MTENLSLARALIPAVRAAGEVEMGYYRADVEVLDKLDGSPVTLADREAEKLIEAELVKIAPGIPMIGEEAVAVGRIPDISGGTFFLVDPLDGTRSFITGNDDFTVNVALLRDFRPVMGLILIPATGVLYYGADGEAFREDDRIAARTPPPGGLTIVSSRRSDRERVEEFLQGRKVVQSLSRSSSLKFCLIAEGVADFYPRLGPTSEWDTAAGEAILHAAGGKVARLDGSPLVYGKADRKFLNPEFVASGR